jgi:SAM-dependent methyltransferase
MCIPEKSRSWWTKGVAAVLGHFYTLLYTRLSALYDLTAWFVSGGEWEEWAASLLPYIPVDLCLEVGHGPGHLLGRLGNTGIAAVGIDLSMDMSRRALSAAAASEAAFGVVNATAERLPFPDGEFGCVVSTFPAPIVYAPSSLREAHRVLRRGGVFLSLPGVATRPRRLRDIPGHVLFRLTGADEDALSEAMASLVHPLHQAGFKGEVISCQHSNATLYILQAQKP